MFHYDFPTIRHLSDVLPVIKGREEFNVLRNEPDITIIQYEFRTCDTFPPVTHFYEDVDNAILRECRGITFRTSTGEIISRPYHKFHNLGERSDETPDWDERHWVLEKLDGSMVRPIPVGGDALRWATKRGVTQTALQVEQHIAKLKRRAVMYGIMRECPPEPISDYDGFCLQMIRRGYTPIFEWCSNKQRIVVDQPTDRLVLTALRNTVFGYYASYNAMLELAKLHAIPVVRLFESVATDNLEEFVGCIRGQENNEGIVVRFLDGQMVKVKTDWYVGLHRAKSLLENERDVLRAVIEDREDDLAPLLALEDRERLGRYAASVRQNIRAFVFKVVRTLRWARNAGLTRKQFADYSVNFESFERRAAFIAFNQLTDICAGNVVGDWVKEHVLKHLVSFIVLQKKI